MVVILLLPAVEVRCNGNSSGNMTSDFNTRFNSMIEKIRDMILSVLSAIKDAALQVGRIMAGTLIALGVVLWASDIFSYKGKKLVISGIILLIIIELLIV